MKKKSIRILLVLILFLTITSMQNKVQAFVGSIAYMGIKYMTTTSPEKQAPLKIQTVGLLVSGIVIFGAYPIWCIVVDILKVASS